MMFPFSTLVRKCPKKVLVALLAGNLGVCSYNSSVLAVHDNADRVALSFDDPFSSSLFKHVLELAMELWGDVDVLRSAAVNNEDLEQFAHSMADPVLLLYQKTVQLVETNNQGRGVHEEDVVYVHDVLTRVTENMQDLFQAVVSEYASCINVLLNKTTERLATLAKPLDHQNS